MEIYDKYCGDPGPDAKEFAARFAQLMNIDYYQPVVLKSDEGSHSAFQALDRFLFHDGKNGYVLHRPIFKEDNRHCNSPDGYVAK